MKPESLLVSHDGWLLFCPVYYSEQNSEAVAKHSLWLLFDVAVTVVKYRNKLYTLVGIKSQFPFRLTPLPQPKIITK
jgi:hypothetical protein